MEKLKKLSLFSDKSNIQKSPKSLVQDVKDIGDKIDTELDRINSVDVGQKSKYDDEKKDYSEMSNFGAIGGVMGAVAGSPLGLPGIVGGAYLGHKAQDFIRAKSKQNQDKLAVQRYIAMTGGDINDAEKIVAPVPIPIVDPLKDTLNTINDARTMPASMTTFSDPNDSVLVPLALGGAGLGVGTMIVPKDTVEGPGKVIKTKYDAAKNIIGSPEIYGDTNFRGVEVTDELVKKGYVEGSEAYKEQLKKLADGIDDLKKEGKTPKAVFTKTEQLAPLVSRSGAAKLKIAAIAAAPVAGYFAYKNIIKPKAVENAGGQYMPEINKKNDFDESYVKPLEYDKITMEAKNLKGDDLVKLREQDIGLENRRLDAKARAGRLELAGKVYTEGKNLVGKGAAGTANLAGKGFNAVKSLGKGGLIVGAGVVGWDLLRANKLQRLQDTENNLRFQQYLLAKNTPVVKQIVPVANTSNAPLAGFSDPEKFRVKENKNIINVGFSDPEKFRV